MKNKTVLVVLLSIATLALAVIAVVTALRLQQIGKEPVAPTAPAPAPALEPVCTTTFTIERPDLCKTATIDTSTLKPGESVTITSETKTSANNFSYAFYNLDNLYGPNNPKPICVKTGGDVVVDSATICPSGSHHLIFKDSSTASRTTGSRTLKYEDIFVADENNGGKVVGKIQVNSYFSVTGGATSLPNGACVVSVSAGVSASPSPSPSASPSLSPSPSASPSPSPSPSPPPPSGCFEECVDDADCDGSLICSSGQCVNHACPSEEDCKCNVGGPSPTPTPTPETVETVELPEAGISLPTWGLLSAGMTTVLLGILVLLL